MLRVDNKKIQKISSFTKELSSQIFNIDENNYMDEINQHLQSINKKKYNNYYKNYISYNVNNNKKIGEAICNIYSKK